jgi:hypothetical protein
MNSGLAWNGEWRLSFVLVSATWVSNPSTGLGCGLGTVVVDEAAALCGVGFGFLGGAELSARLGNNLGLGVWRLVDPVEAWMEVLELDPGESLIFLRGS